MSELAAFELEGRLNAQRELLALILSGMAARDSDLLALIERKLAVADHQEDPGAVPQAAFAVEGSRSAEVQAILSLARQLADDSHVPGDGE